MNVAFISTDKSILTGKNGDARERHFEYAKHFSELIVVIFSLAKDGMKAETVGNLRLIPTRSRNRWFYIFDSLLILSKLQRVDLVSTQDPFLTALVGVVAKLFWRYKLNIQIHNDFFYSLYFCREKPQNYLFYWLGKFTLLFADSVRAVNGRLKYGAKSFVAPVPVDLEFFRGQPHLKRYNQIVTVARLSKQKNLPLFFALARSFPGLEFVVVGDGEERKNLEKIQPKNVLLAGQKSRSEVRKILSKSDLFVLTSNYEGWGISVLEALAAGLSVVMTDTGCAGEVVIDGVTGKVIQQGDLQSLVSAVTQLVEDRTLGERYVVAGQKLIKTNFSREKITRDFINGLKATVTN